MAITYTDSYGPVVDTGSGTQPTARANTEVEFHVSGEVDTGTKGLTIPTGPSLTLSASSVPRGRPHREYGSPR